MPNNPLGTFGDLIKSKGKEVQILQEDVALFKHLIREHKHPLDLIRELLSNAGATEVGATRIDVTYTVDRLGHIFEVSDDGCGMNFTGDKTLPGRLDRFLGLGLSAIVGREADEFAWKGLGSKLCFQSRRVEVETRFRGHPLYRVIINEPWETLDRKQIPKPQLSEHDDTGDFKGTRIKVYGHPPHRLERPFTLEEISAFLLHRTFAGFTRSRPNAPEIQLSVLGQTSLLPFGFPELDEHRFENGLVLDEAGQTLWVDLSPSSAKAMRVELKGLLTWDAHHHGLDADKLNTGAILSAKGIPYFELDMEEYGARGIVHANPGKRSTCLIVECDAVHSEMNISRSGLVDSAETLRFKETLRDLFGQLEAAPEYLAFRQVPKKMKTVIRGDALEQEKRVIESQTQRWVLLERPGQEPKVLMREPRNEEEVNALVWKLEALEALPFARFQTLAYPGAAGGPDLLVNFQEDKSSEPQRTTVIEVENNFYSYKDHGHHTPQYPKVICWDAPTSGRKVHLIPTSKKYKFTVTMDEHQLHVFVIRLMDGIKVLTRRELAERGLDLL